MADISSSPRVPATVVAVPEGAPGSEQVLGSGTPLMWVHALSPNPTRVCVSPAAGDGSEAPMTDISLMEPCISGATDTRSKARSMGAVSERSNLYTTSSTTPSTSYPVIWFPDHLVRTRSVPKTSLSDRMQCPAVSTRVVAASPVKSTKVPEHVIAACPFPLSIVSDTDASLMRPEVTASPWKTASAEGSTAVAPRRAARVALKELERNFMSDLFFILVKVFGLGDKFVFVRQLVKRAEGRDNRFA